MSESDTPAAADMTGLPPVVVKKYANRRLYNTESSSYITLDNLATMIRQRRDFVVYDAKTGDDITRGVLTQIIMDEESKGRAMLPTAFLRQIIGFYGDNMQQFIPAYLEQAMSAFAVQQEQMRSAMTQTMTQTMGSFFPFNVQEVGRQNMAMMERAMSLFTPFLRPPGSPGQESSATGDAHGGPSHPVPDMLAMRHEIEMLRAQLAAARSMALAPHEPETAAEPAAAGVEGQ